MNTNFYAVELSPDSSRFIGTGRRPRRTESSTADARNKRRSKTEGRREATGLQDHETTRLWTFDVGCWTLDVGCWTFFRLLVRQSRSPLSRSLWSFLGLTSDV